MYLPFDIRSLRYNHRLCSIVSLLRSLGPSHHHQHNSSSGSNHSSSNKSSSDQHPSSIIHVPHIHSATNTTAYTIKTKLDHPVIDDNEKEQCFDNSHHYH